MSSTLCRIVDFEASSLADESFPIEVGWCDLDGCGEAHLIIPEPEWVDWDVRSEGIHGISQAVLRAKGNPANIIAGVYARANTLVHLYADGISDQRWSDRLLAAAGLASLQIHSVIDLYGATLRPLLSKLPAEVHFRALNEFIRDAEHAAAERHPVRHRALEDARRLATTNRLLAERVAQLVG